MTPPGNHDGLTSRFIRTYHQTVVRYKVGRHSCMIYSGLSERTNHMADKLNF